MKSTTDQLETQLADLAKRLGSARFWLRLVRNDLPRIHLAAAREVRQLEAEFARLNARLARRRRKTKKEKRK